MIPMIPPGPVRSVAMAWAASSMLGCRHQGPFGGEVLLHEAQVPGLHQVDGPGPRVRPEAVVVDSGPGPDDVAGLEEQCVGIGEIALGEQVGQDTDDVVAEFGRVAVDTGVQWTPLRVIWV